MSQENNSNQEIKENKERVGDVSDDSLMNGDDTASGSAQKNNGAYHHPSLMQAVLGLFGFGSRRSSNTKKTDKNPYNSETQKSTVKSTKNNVVDNAKNCQDEPSKQSTKDSKVKGSAKSTNKTNKTKSKKPFYLFIVVFAVVIIIVWATSFSGGTSSQTAPSMESMPTVNKSAATDHIKKTMAASIKQPSQAAILPTSSEDTSTTGNSAEAHATPSMSIGVTDKNLTQISTLYHENTKVLLKAIESLKTEIQAQAKLIQNLQTDNQNLQQAIATNRAQIGSVNEAVKSVSDNQQSFVSHADFVNYAKANTHALDGIAQLIQKGFAHKGLASSADLPFEVTGFTTLVDSGSCQVMTSHDGVYQGVLIGDSLMGWALKSSNCNNHIAVFTQGSKQVVVGGVQ
ncbi:hypothetical protein [Cysteiniphilum halobium]|uniref:hypothetical protein n=1 Tax=Cysteiniphilum halobium TaxID=2219059 RepID=UPI000E65B055|nr:hypothetical protein [Cysteiniphilum halobium]